ncbi:hypothetical protein K9L97_05480 [Candidatus Woesearchaeota archaeon]|nr:hypothetical protein [Candidatus Woesearchaeota archaeon]
MKRIFLILAGLLLVLMGCTSDSFDVTCNPETLECVDQFGNVVEIVNPYDFISEDDIRSILEDCVEVGQDVFVLGTGCVLDCVEADSQYSCFTIDVINEKLLRGICTYSDLDKNEVQCDYVEAIYTDSYYDSCSVDPVGLEGEPCDSGLLNDGYQEIGVCSNGVCISEESEDTGNSCVDLANGTLCSNSQGTCCNDVCVSMGSLSAGEFCCASAECSSNVCTNNVCVASNSGGGGGGGSGVCNPVWVCSKYSICSSEGIRTRNCNDLNNCGVNSSMPETVESCTYIEYSDQGSNMPGEDSSGASVNTYQAPSSESSGTNNGYEDDSGENGGLPSVNDNEPVIKPLKKKVPVYVYIVGVILVVAGLGAGVIIYLKKRHIL